MKKRRDRGRVALHPRHVQQIAMAHRQWQAFLAGLPRGLRATARRLRARLPRCLLCGQAPQAGHTLAAFVPRDAQRWGAPPGLARGVCYALCRACVALDDKADRAEAILWEMREH
jgi:hypothetical protein